MEPMHTTKRAESPLALVYFLRSNVARSELFQMKSRKAVLECFSLFVHVTSAHGIVLWQEMRSVRGALWRIPNMVTWWSTFPSLALWFHLYLTDCTKSDFEAQSKKFKNSTVSSNMLTRPSMTILHMTPFTSLPQSPTFSVWPPFWSRHPSLFWTKGHRNRCPNLRPRNEVGTSSGIGFCTLPSRNGKKAHRHSPSPAISTPESLHSFIFITPSERLISLWTLRIKLHFVQRKFQRSSKLKHTFQVPLHVYPMHVYVFEGNCNLQLLLCCYKCN